MQLNESRIRRRQPGGASLVATWAAGSVRRQALSTWARECPPAWRGVILTRYFPSGEPLFVSFGDERRRGLLVLTLTPVGVRSVDSRSAPLTSLRYGYQNSGRSGR